MKIEDIVAKIQKTTTDRDADPLLRALMDRLEGMLPNTDTARAVAEAAGMSKEQALRTSDQPLVRWSRLVWWLHGKSRLEALVPAVLPHLPEGQPYSSGEFTDIDTEIVSATLARDHKALSAAQNRKAEMAGWNTLVAKGGVAPTPAPITMIVGDEPKGRSRRGKKRAA